MNENIIYLAVGYGLPKTHENCLCVRFNVRNKTLSQVLENFSSVIVEDILTSKVCNIDPICPNIFNVETLNSTYIYQDYNPVNAASEPKTYLAFGSAIPTVGYHYECYCLKYNSCYPEHVLTSTVKKIESIAQDVYKIETNNSIYVVQVIR